MWQEVVVHERVMRRHPNLPEEGVKHAWRNAFVLLDRHGGPSGTYIALGVDENGRVLEMIGATLLGGQLMIYHALTPPTRDFLRETGLE